MGHLVEDLGSQALEVVETHISWVFLHPDTVLKVKKPVNFGFLDFSTPDARRQACEAEVRLNSRLSPDVYLEVLRVTRNASGEHEIEGSGPVVDYAVHMRRLPDAARADQLLAAGRLEWGQVEALVGLLARFHAHASHSPEIDEFGRVATISKNVRENFTQAHGALAQLVSDAQQREIEAWQLDFLEQHAARFERRIAAHRVKDGHGDLRLEHVYFNEPKQPTILDCIEFNERFRFGDVASDIAFLSMDLAWHGHVELKERFVSAYARETNDYDLYGVLDFYESYRAYVRAKVSALGYSSGNVSYAARQRLEREARQYFLLSVASERPSLGAPRLLAFGGMIASGKSTLADKAAFELAIPAISSDRTRKALSGVSAETRLGAPAWADAYSEDATSKVYAEVFRLARVVLSSGRSVVLDASFRTRAVRAAARTLALETGASFTFIECRARESVLRERLATRAKGPSVSDGRLELLGTFQAAYERVDELAPSEHVVVDTGGDLTQSLDLLRRAGVTGPAGKARR